jgi:hypothetical protein
VIDVDVGGFVKWFKNAGQKLKVQTRLAVGRTAEAAATYARLSRLYKNHTYGLRSSIRTTKGDTEASASANAKYAHWVESGTRPHAIEPRRKKVLRFERNGEVFFRTRVFHPGTDPRPFMRTAQEQATPLFSRLVTAAATEAFR